MTRLVLLLALAGFAFAYHAPIAHAGFGTVVVVTSGEPKDARCNDKHRAVRCRAPLAF